MVLLAFSLQDQVEKYGAYVGIAAFFGLAILSLLYFAQAREVKRLREWAGRAPERAAELEGRAIAAAEEKRAVAAAAAAPGPRQRGGGRAPPRRRRRSPRRLPPRRRPRPRRPAMAPRRRPLSSPPS